MSPLRHCRAAALALTLAAGAAHAQAPAGPPPPRSGFQMAARAGVALPYGKVSALPGDDLSGLVGVQVPLMLDIGGKLGHHVFLGGYLGLGFGGVGSQLSDACGVEAFHCASGSLRLGAQVQYNAAPASRANPWFGYGIGIESTAVTVSGPRGDSTSGVAGFELARLMAGVDFRLPTGFGVGPYVDFTLGRYATAVQEDAFGNDVSSDIRERATHGFVTLGVRIVLFP